MVIGHATDGISLDREARDSLVDERQICSFALRDVQEMRASGKDGWDYDSCLFHRHKDSVVDP